MPGVYLAALINEIQRLETLADQLQLENERLNEDLKSEEDEIEELGDTIAQLEGGKAKLNAELDHLREGVINLAALATKSASH
jgi:predicted nuclease with TOPRIM domain